MLGINTNPSSLSAQLNLAKSGGSLNTSIQRLSSGLRVNSAKDDAAGLAIAERMTAQIRGFDQAYRNANDGVSLLQVADGSLGKISDNLQRMRELAVQAKNGTLNTTDRDNLNREYTTLAEEVGRNLYSAKFNGNELFTTGNDQVDLQVGTGNAAEDTLSVFLNSTGATGGTDLQASIGGTDVATTAAALGTIDGADATNATAALTTLDTTIDTVTNLRATVGAGLSRLEQIAESLESNSTNLSAARGRIMDADFATETANLTRSQILQQAGTAMLAQANQLPQNVLSLLR